MEEILRRPHLFWLGRDYGQISMLPPNVLGAALEQEQSDGSIHFTVYINRATHDNE